MLIHVKVIIARKKNQGNFDRRLYSFLQVSERAFCRIYSFSTKRNDRLKPSKLLDMIEHIGSAAGQSSTSLLCCLGRMIFQTPCVRLFFFIDALCVLDI